MFDAVLVDLSRLQFALTAFVHLFFIPLSLGLTLFIALFETAFAKTRHQAYLQLSYFWQKFYLLNYGLSLLTGLAMSFQLHSHWAHYDDYIEDVFSGSLSMLSQLLLLLPLLCLIAFHYSKAASRSRFVSVWLLNMSSAASILSLLWINAWMQNPQGSEFDWSSMRMRLNDPLAVVFNPLVWSKWLHNIASSYLISASLVAAVSAWYLLTKRHQNSSALAIKFATAVALLACLLLALPNKPWSYQASSIQAIKYNALASSANTPLAQRWNTWLLAQTQLPQAVTQAQLVQQYQSHIVLGAKAHKLWQALRLQDSQSARLEFAYWQHYLGYFWLLPKDQSVNLKSQAELMAVVKNSLPKTSVLRYSYLVMAMIGLLCCALWLCFFWYQRPQFKAYPQWLLRLSIMLLPLPWLASGAGWLMSEYGRQPWIIAGILPTKASVSAGQVSDLYTSLLAFSVLYLLLLLIVLLWQWLILRTGPQSVRLKYHQKQENTLIMTEK